MRIIAGIYKRRQLVFPKSKSVRPTMDRVKESLFNMLGTGLADASVLSLFSGSGSLGFEALSRGAVNVVFVDSFPESIRCITENVEQLHISREKVEIIRADALESIARFHRQKRVFDYIFIDPPYYGDFIKKTLLKLEAFDILSPLSTLVIEHAKDEPVPESRMLSIVKTRRFGATCITICKKV